MVKKIYLHWTAGRYDQFFNDYHICIDGDGVVHKMADFETKLAHTWKRNTDAVGIAMCCCYGASIARAPLRIKNEELRMKNCGKDGPDTLRDLNSVTGTDHDNCSLLSVNCSLNEPWLINWGEYPPTKEQILSMAHCVADICKQYNLPVNKETVMTHAEVADMDGYGLHDNDPDLRWDLLRLPFAANISGGEYIRGLAKQMASELDIAYGDVR